MRHRSLIGGLHRNLVNLAIVAAVAAGALGVTGVAAAQHPIPSGQAARWELRFEPGDLRLYIDPVEQRAFWFFTYKVTNRTGKRQIWAPTFTIFTDTGDIRKSGEGVPTRVTGDLIRLLQNEFLEDQNSIIGDILHGREHAKEGLVIWPAADLTVNEVSMFVRGISGESARVRNPVTGEQVVLYKTLQRDYLIPGDALARGTAAVDLVHERWIMR